MRVNYLSVDLGGAGKLLLGDACGDVDALYILDRFGDEWVFKGHIWRQSFIFIPAKTLVKKVDQIGVLRL